jgi:hypothetical protein
MSNILKGIFEAPPKDIDWHHSLTKGPDLFTPSKYTIVDGLGRYVGDIYNSYSEAEKELSKFKNKYTQVKIIELPKKVTEDLRKWFKEKWVRFGPDGKIRGDCARGDDSEGKPKCLPQKKAQALGKKGRKYAATKKRREDPDPERKGAAKNVATKKKTNEEQLDELKCWPGYTRVQGVLAGAPGSCKKKTNEEDLGMTEGQPIVSVKKWAEQVRQEHGVDTKFWNDKVHNRIIARKDKEIVGSYDRKANNGTVFSPEKGVAEGSTARGGFGGSAGQAYHEIEWLKNKIETLKPLLAKKPSVARQIKDLERQIRERELAIAYQKEGVAEGSEEKCPHCGGELVSEELMNEKQDACYHKVKSRYKVWPSAYASGALVKCRKKGAKNWGNKSESAIMRGIQNEQNVKVERND